MSHATRHRWAEPEPGQSTHRQVCLNGCGWVRLTTSQMFGRRLGVVRRYERDHYVEGLAPSCDPCDDERTFVVVEGKEGTHDRIP